MSSWEGRLSEGETNRAADCFFLSPPFPCFFSLLTDKPCFCRCRRRGCATVSPPFLLFCLFFPLVADERGAKFPTSAAGGGRGPFSRCPCWQVFLFSEEAISFPPPRKLSPLFFNGERQRFFYLVYSISGFFLTFSSEIRDPLHREPSERRHGETAARLSPSSLFLPPTFFFFFFSPPEEGGYSPFHRMAWAGSRSSPEFSLNVLSNT